MRSELRAVAAILGVTVGGIAFAHAHERQPCTSAITMRVPLSGGVADIGGLNGSLAPQTEAQWRRVLDVRVATADTSLPAIAGQYEHSDGGVRFRPAFPFVAGTAYRVRFDGSKLGWSNDACAHGAGVALDTSFTIPNRAAAQPTRVVSVFPTINVLPMNQLKLYIHFSAPMRAGEAAAHARIVDEIDGTVVQDAFYNPNDELWNLQQTRLTLLFDPGRIKRGLKPNEAMGLPLRAGRRYRLEIDATWRNANGEPLPEAFVKRFVVTAPDRVAPRIATWKVDSPRAGTVDPLTISFGEPMDAALLEHVLSVRDPDGKPVAGRVVAVGNETRWRFVPSAQWRAARYTIRVGTELEDLAGNNLRRLFDTDLSDRSAPALERGAEVSLAVNIR